MTHYKIRPLEWTKGDHGWHAEEGFSIYFSRMTQKYYLHTSTMEIIRETKELSIAQEYAQQIHELTLLKKYLSKV